MPLTLFLLLLVFGTIVAAGLPVMLGAAAVVTALGALYLVAQRMETSIFAMNTASMIGLGLGHRLLAVDGEPLPRGAGTGTNAACRDRPARSRRPASRSSSRA